MGTSCGALLKEGGRAGDRAQSRPHVDAKRGKGGEQAVRSIHDMASEASALRAYFKAVPHHEGFLRRDDKVVQ